ncbi:MAG: hypothetical protein C5B50_10365 [Verrucomicrobia bacterium]|nr:MAG: hypothetical protein C5B50_10365 [Verrucomicrobiota bacterium]
MTRNGKAHLRSRQIRRGRTAVPGIAGQQERDLREFERVFRVYPGAPEGEPTQRDQEAIGAAIKQYRKKAQS